MKGFTVSRSDLMFEDYCNTKMVYHIAPLIDLKEIIGNGLRVDKSCSSKYCDFNNYFDKYKPYNIPEWVSRKKAIYGSLNFEKDHKWHSHSVILSFKINKDKCWVGNENLANILYEPFVLRDISIFSSVNRFFEVRGKQFAIDYWRNSTSFVDNLITRFDRYKGYDAEVLIMHDIPPKDIKILKIISDHKTMDIGECNNMFSSLLQT